MTIEGTSTLSGNQATEDGGAVYSRGTVEIAGGALSDNEATNGGAIYSYGGTVTIEGTSTLSGNTATNDGGAVYSRGTVEIAGGALSDNEATNGGAIYNSFKGTVKITGGVIQGNQADVGQGIYHSASGETLEVSGAPQMAEGQWIYMGADEVVHVTGALNLSRGLQVDFPDACYVEDYEVAVYAGGLTPNPTDFTLRQTDLMHARGLSLVAEGQKLVLRYSAFDVTQAVTLYAAADPTADQPQSVAVKLADLGVDLSRLEGLELTVESVTLPAGSPLETPVSSAEVKDRKTTAGSDYANSTVAITALPGGIGQGATPTDLIEAQKLTFGTTLDEATATLTLELHCANAITVPDSESTAPELTIVLQSAKGDKITLNVKVVRVASQINATVPLALVVKTDIEGGAIEGSDLTGYEIRNHSSMRVQLTHARVTDSGETYGDGVSLTPAEGESAPGEDAYRITLEVETGQDGALTTPKDLFAEGEQNDACNPIAKIETGKLSFVTAQAAAGEVQKGVKLANIAYTLVIPREDLQQP